MFAPSLTTELSQGDIVDDIEITEAFSTPPSSLERVVVVTNDCDIDKRSQDILLVARVWPIDRVEEQNKGLAGSIRKGRVAAAMLLGPHPDLPESFVDFRFLFRVPRDACMEAMNRGRRLASMSEDGRLAVLARLYSYFARRNEPGRPVANATTAPPTA